VLVPKLGGDHGFVPRAAQRGAEHPLVQPEHFPINGSGFEECYAVLEGRQHDIVGAALPFGQRVRPAEVVPSGPDDGDAEA